MLVIKDKGGGRTKKENIFANFSKLSLPIGQSCFGLMLPNTCPMGNAHPIMTIMQILDVDGANDDHDPNKNDDDDYDNDDNDDDNDDDDGNDRDDEE